MFGTNCYTSAVRALRRGCADLGTEEQLWLAFHMTNCFFTKTGKHGYTCGHMEFSKCAERMTSADYTVFSQFFQNVNSMCLFIANADFNARAEATLNSLVNAGTHAAAKVRMQRFVTKLVWLL